VWGGGGGGGDYWKVYFAVLRIEKGGWAGKIKSRLTKNDFLCIIIIRLVNH